MDRDAHPLLLLERQRSLGLEDAVFIQCFDVDSDNRRSLGNGISFIIAGAAVAGRKMGGKWDAALCFRETLFRGMRSQTEFRNEGKNPSRVSQAGSLTGDFAAYNVFNLDPNYQVTDAVSDDGSSLVLTVSALGGSPRAGNGRSGSAVPAEAALAIALREDLGAAAGWHDGHTTAVEV